MIKIGYDEEDIEKERKIFEKQDEELKHGVKSKRTYTPVYIPEKRIPEILKNYDCVVVNDFGDDYHLSDEERSKKSEFYEIFRKLNRSKHKYRKVDQYVTVMREALKCLDTVAENNKIYDPEKFKLMVLKGKITVNGLFFPRFIGKDKKYMSTEFLTEFILGDEDPSTLIKSKVEEVYDDDDCEEIVSKFFDKEEIEKMKNYEESDNSAKKFALFDPDNDKQTSLSYAVELDNKTYKRILKDDLSFIYLCKQVKEDSLSIQSMSRYAYELTADDLDFIERYDQKHNYVSKSDVPAFTGSIMNKNDYNRYMNELDEWAGENIYDNYHGKTKSINEIQEIELKAVLESNGWNIRALYENKEKEKRLKKQLKRDKQREKELRQKLIDIDNRRKRRMGESIEDIKKENKKNKKKKKQKRI